ncbi:MAG: hypothetical protein ACTSWY_06875 [Promethearchaeota archaeon]
MSEKSLYSEVKKRKMAALGKKDLVKAVEKHGKILAIRGKYEKPENVIKYSYASVKDFINPERAHKKDLSRYDLVMVGCPGNKISKMGLSKLSDFVFNDGGWLLTTDWCLRTIVEEIFPGYLRWSGEKTTDTVVQCEMTDSRHPFLDGVYSEIMGGIYSKGPKKYGKKPTFSWWLEDKSFPITIERPDDVHVLIRSEELGRKWKHDPVLVYFDVGKKGGRVIHMISHTHLQKGGKKGKFVSALILTNILDEKVSIKYGVGKSGGTPQYEDYGTPTSQSSIEWASSSQPEGNQIPELVGTTKIVEITEAPLGQKCALGDGNFDGYTGRIFKCTACGALYHQNCLNVQLQSGICKVCEKIFLY